MKMTPIDTPAMTPATTPRIRMCASAFDRGIGAVADVRVYVNADVSPTFLKDAFTGVRAWSPPV